MHIKTKIIIFYLFFLLMFCIINKIFICFPFYLVFEKKDNTKIQFVIWLFDLD